MSIDINSDVPLNPASLTESDKRELKQFVAEGEQKGMIQMKIHQLTSSCFKRCITSEGSSLARSQGNLNSSEESCMTNCVNRYMDANLAVLKHLDKLRG